MKLSQVHNSVYKTGFVNILEYALRTIKKGALYQ
jgi:hypothetical protein